MKNIIKIVFAISALYLSACQSSGGKGKLSVDEFESVLTKTPNAQLIDVRTTEEFLSGHLKNAVNIDINSQDFEQKVNALDKSIPTFVYCLSGGRSSAAASMMRKGGFKIVYEMPGVMAWRNAGKELTTSNEVSVAKGLSIEAYQQLVTDSSKIVLVDFSATWCLPCKELTPIVKKIAYENESKLILRSLDADENADLLNKKGIDGIPYLEAYKDGKLIWQHQGLLGEDEINKALSLK